MFSKFFTTRGRRTALSLLLAAIFSLPASAEYDVDFNASLTAGVGSNDFAPYFQNSLKHGKITQSKNLLIDLGAYHHYDRSKRFSYCWGVEALAGVSSTVDYTRYSADQNLFFKHAERPPYIWLQQLYGEIKFRSVFLSVGPRERGSMLVDNNLSSGDLVWSGNTRPIPEVRIGFLDYQNIPLTNKWVQIEGAVAYGAFTDYGWTKSHFNYLSQMICDGRKWIYKRIYFRTNPDKPFHVIAGVQNTGLFGGTTYFYSQGRVKRTQHNGNSLKDYLTMLVPIPNDKGAEGHYDGDHKGSWDFRATYRLRNRDEISAYFQWFWEDGSAMAKRNGWDGLWGIQYKRGERGWFNSALVEYFDFTNMSGPLHFQPSQNPGTSITTAVGGNDNYYNNVYYGAYSNYGMTIGTPLLMGNIFNLDGNPLITFNRVRAIHIAATGSISNNIDWTVRFNHRKGWGQPNSKDMLHPLHATSFAIEASWRIPQVSGLALSGSFAFDKGNFPQNACGLLLTLSYDNPFKFGKKHSK